MSDDKNKNPDRPYRPSDIDKVKNDILKGDRSGKLDESVDWTKIDKQRGNFTNNLPDYDAPPPPPAENNKD